MVTPGLYPLLTEAQEHTSDDSRCDDDKDDDDHGDEDYEDWKWDRKTLVKAEGLRCSLTSGTSITSLVVLKNGLQPIKG